MKKMKKMMAVLLAVSMMPMSVYANDYSGMLDKGSAYADAEEYDKAFAAYDLAEKVADGRTDALAASARLAIDLGDARKALEKVEKILEQEPFSVEGWMLKVEADLLGLANGAADIDELTSDLLYADVCGCDLHDLAGAIAMQLAMAGRSEEAIGYFALADFSSLSEEERETYRRELLKAGRQEEAEAPGLTRGEIRDVRLDALFDQKNIVLKETENGGISLKEQTFVPPEFAYMRSYADSMEEGIGDEEIREAIGQLEAMVQEQALEILSISPDGISALLRSRNDRSVNFAWHKGELHLILPYHVHGVPDAYGNLEMLFSGPGGFLNTVLGSDGVIWSPGGRYAAITNTKMTLMMLKFLIDPMVIDLSTGELILLRTFGSKMMDDANGAMTTACFSKDERYFYYAFYGKMEQDDYSGTKIMRYDLLTGEEICCGSLGFPAGNYYPHLYETEQGNLIILLDSSKADEPKGVSLLRPAGSGYERETYTFSDPALRANVLRYSANSGYALALFPGLGGYVNGNISFLTVFKPDEDMEGFGEFWAFYNDDSGVRLLDGEDVLDLCKNPELARESADGGLESVCGFCLSPDGNYALVAVGGKEHRLLLARLSDRETVEVQGIDSGQIMFGDRAQLIYPPVMEWNSDTIIMGMSDGIHTYVIGD